MPSFTLPLATSTNSGLLAPGEKTKLDGVAAGATANATNAELRDRSTHTGTQAASTISDFSEAVDDRVSSLLVAGSNVTLTYNDAANTLEIGAASGSGSNDRADHTGTQLASTISDFSEAVDDRVSSLLVAGTNLTLSYNDASNSLTINATGSNARADHTGTQAASTISDFAEAVDDRVSSLLTEGDGVELTYDDGAGTLSVAMPYLSKRKTFAGLGLAEGSSDQASTLTSALAGLTAGDYIDGQGKTYRLASQATIPKGLVIENVNFELTAAANVYPLRAAGTLGSSKTCSTAAAKGIYQYTLNSSSGLTAGSPILFYRSLTAPAGFAADSTGETWWSTIASIDSGTVISLADAYPSHYTLSSTNLVAYVPTVIDRLRLYNVTGFRTDTLDGTHFFRADYCKNLELDVCTAYGMRESAFAVTASRGVNASRLKVRGVDQEGLGYGVVLVNGVEDARVADSLFEDCRHGITAGGTGGIDRNLIFSGNICRGTRAAGIDCHPQVDQVSIINNHIYCGSMHRDVTDAGVVGGKEGIVFQGANGTITGNEVYGFRGASDSVDGVGVMAQMLTRMPYDTFRINGNRIGRITGAGVYCVYALNQKPAGDIYGWQVSDNIVECVDYGGNGATSPSGIVIEGHADAAGYMYSGTVAGNQVLSRTTALKFVTSGTEFIRSVTVTGGNYQIVNTDAPVITISAAASGYIDRLDFSGVNTYGGTYGISNTNGTNITRTGGTIASFATAATTGTITDIANSTAAGRSMLSAADAAAQTALLNTVTSSLKGLAPASGGGTTNFLRADLTWAAPSGGGGNTAGLMPRLGVTGIRGAQHGLMSVTNNGTIVTGTLIAVPMSLDADITLNRLGLRFNSTTSGVNCRVGVAVDTNGVPTTLVADSGDFASTAGFQEVTGIGVSMTRGRYWLLFSTSGSLTGGVWCQTAASVSLPLGVNSAGSATTTFMATGLSATFTHGAFASDLTGTSWTILTNSTATIPAIMWGT